ncbi:MAG: MFS transporter [Desulfobacterota bacterium]|nr:MFS transporter [Thermodesulfobacteriota bacterium]
MKKFLSIRFTSTPLPAVLVATFTSGFAFGVALPIASVILEERSVATPLIGLTATIVFVGWALGSPFAGRMIELHGVRRTLFSAMFIAGCCMVGHGLIRSLPFWFFVRLFIGCASAAIFTACETLINRIGTNANRGMYLGLYACAFSASLMVGPAGLWLLQFGTWLPFLVSGIFCCCAAFVVRPFIPQSHEPAPEATLDLSFVRRIALSLTAMLMAGFLEGALISLIPVYALRRGFGEAQAAMLMSSFMIGHGCMPPLMGLVSDRIGLRSGLLVTYGLGSVSFVMLIFIPGSIWIAGMLFIGGAAVGALYPLAIGLLATALSSSELPRGNALTAFCYGIGSIIGPFIPSLIMHVTVPHTLFAVAAVLYLGAFIIMQWNTKQAPAPRS